jgi:hypothetical protein
MGKVPFRQMVISGSAGGSIDAKMVVPESTGSWFARKSEFRKAKKVGERLNGHF